MRLRSVSLLLSSCFLLSSTGCITAERRANRHWNRVGVGMTREDVQKELGEPDYLAVGAGQETWHYSYGSRPDPAKIATVTGQTLAIVTFFGACLLLMAWLSSQSQSGGSLPAPDIDGPWPQGDGSTDSDTVHFRVVFDWRGMVISVSGIEPCDEE
jgi:hypothetical protein